MVERSAAAPPESRSLESLAANRGITICFVDLDGAEGLWLPEERTVLLARGLTDKQAAAVLEHELSHVDIEDGHAHLDAAMHRNTGRVRWAVAGTALASLALLIGVRAQVHPQRIAETRPDGANPVEQVTTTRSQPVAATTPTGTRVIRVKGPVQTETVTVTPDRPPAAPTPTPTPRPAGSSSTATTPGLQGASLPTSGGGGTTPSPTPTTKPSTPPPPDPTPDPTTSVSPSSPDGIPTSPGLGGTDPGLGDTPGAGGTGPGSADPGSADPGSGGTTTPEHSGTPLQ